MLGAGQVRAVGSFDELLAGNADFRALMTAEAKSPA